VGGGEALMKRPDVRFFIFSRAPPPTPHPLPHPVDIFPNVAISPPVRNVPAALTGAAATYKQHPWQPEGIGHSRLPPPPVLAEHIKMECNLYLTSSVCFHMWCEK